jgi:hypothetical protein
MPQDPASRLPKTHRRSNNNLPSSTNSPIALLLPDPPTSPTEDLPRFSTQRRDRCDRQALLARHTQGDSTLGVLGSVEDGRVGGDEGQVESLGEGDDGVGEHIEDPFGSLGKVDSDVEGRFSGLGKGVLQQQQSKRMHVTSRQLIALSKDRERRFERTSL